jgi:diadenosine tetraphosphate (Ap4A) HIT family hydrolase
MSNDANSNQTKLDPPKGCVFCSIVAGRLPSRIVWQTEELICFFPLAPEVLGHTLIAPRPHYADIWDAPTSFGASVFEAANFLASLYERKLGSTGFNLLNASGKDAEQSVCQLSLPFLAALHC